MTTERPIVLAIESAIAGGSISLLNDGGEIAHWIGDGQVSRAEELLFNIDATLRSSGVKSSDIGMIAVAAGPGSFTGTRIGIATAGGLKNGLGITMSSQPTLKAMAYSNGSSDQTGAVLPVGRNAVCFQVFNNYVGTNEPTAISEVELSSLMEENDSITWRLHGTLFEKHSSTANAVDYGKNLAYAVGVSCLANPGVIEAAIFVSKTF